SKVERRPQASWGDMRMQAKLTPTMYHALVRTCVVWLCACGVPVWINAQENCQLQRPPRQAAIDANHGFFFFVYPRTVSTGYSGCQTMWDEKGNPVFVLTFEKGEVIKIEATDPSGAEKKQTCEHKHGRLVGQDTSDCPEYGAVKDGLQTLPSI